MNRPRQEVSRFERTLRWSFALVLLIASSLAAVASDAPASATAPLATNDLGDVTPAQAAEAVLQKAGAGVSLIEGSAALIPATPTLALRQFDSIDLSGPYAVGGTTVEKSLELGSGIWITSDGGAVAPDDPGSDAAAVRTLIDAELTAGGFPATTGFRALQFDVSVAASVSSISFELVFQSTESCSGNWDVAAIFVDAKNFAFLEWTDGVVRVIRVAPGAGLSSRGFQAKIGETTTNSPFEGYRCQSDLLSVTGIFDKAGKTPDSNGRTNHRIVLAVSDTGDNVVPSAILIGQGVPGALTTGGITTGPPPGLVVETPPPPSSIPAAPAPAPIAEPGGGVPSTPPGVATGSVGGVPTAPAPSRPSAGAAEFRVGNVETRVDVASSGAGRVGGTGSAPVIEAVRDRVATVSGSGMLPGGIAEVWLPLPNGGSRQVALLPIGPDGRFDGALPFTGELDGRGPLPIGDRTIQLFGVDADGQLTVTNFGVRIEQPGPLAPEPDRGRGVVPALTPGQSLATNAGVPTPVTVTPIPDSRSTRIEGDGWLMDVDVPEGEVRDEGGAPLIEIENGTDSVVRGTGFMPGTRAYVWLMSDPTFLGEVTVRADGSFSGSVPIDGVTAGEHTLQLSGVGTDGFVRAANLGVVLVGDGMPRPTRVPAGDGPLQVPGRALLWVLGLAGTAAIAHRRLIVEGR
jgi:hypothetical protein